MTVIQMIDEPRDGYRPGACNIGPAEIARRRRSGIVGLAAAIALAAVLLAVGAPAWVRVAVWVPLFVGILGFVQARLRFCVGFAAGGLQNLGELGSELRVTDAAARRADLRRAVLVTGAVAAVAALITLAFVALPA